MVTKVNEVNNELISVEVAYALPEEQALIELKIAKGGNVRQAIEQSGILEKFPSIDLEINKVGIFSRVCQLDRVMEQGERVEIYRPLLIDPKEKRRQRAGSK